MLSESVAQEAPQSAQTFSLDALETMTPAPMASQAVDQVADASVQQVASPQMLSLDEMIAQPGVTSAPNALDTQATLPPAELSPAAVTAASPLTAPTAYPPIQTPAPHSGYAKIITGVVAAVLFVAVGAMFLLKYPDLMQQFSSETDTPPPIIQEGQVEVPGSESEHPSADQLPSDIPESPVPTQSTTEERNDIVPDLSAVEVDEPLDSEDIQNIVLEQPDQNLSHLVEESPSEVSGEEKTDSYADQSAQASAQSSQGPDVLSAVEDLVGSVNPESVMTTDIELLRQE